VICDMWYMYANIFKVMSKKFCFCIWVVLWLFGTHVCCESDENVFLISFCIYFLLFACVYFSCSALSFVSHRSKWSTQNASSGSSERGRGESHLSPPTTPHLFSLCLDLECVFVCACVVTRARIDFCPFSASDISNRSSAPWLSWVNILASERHRGDDVK